MINNNYTKCDELTSYDKFLLSKKEYYADKQKIVKATEDVIVKSDRVNSNYEDYLLNELRRTTPPKAPILREDEYLVKCTSTSQSKISEKKINIQFKKYGKIILAVYVMFVLGLAFIVIGGSTTDITSRDSAGAAKISETVSSSENVRPMNIVEDQGEQSNWFDKLCDSLVNKTEN